jgi:hypothetical protein
MDTAKLEVANLSTGCTSDLCTQADKPMIARSHGPSSCPAAPPKTCSECGQVKADVPALLAAPIYGD